MQNRTGIYIFTNINVQIVHMRLAILVFISFYLCLHSYGQTSTQVYTAVSFDQVKITDDFWQPKIKKVGTTTLNACILQTEVKTPRIRNFEKVARKAGEKHEGIYYDDSDVYKALEAMAFSLQTTRDATLEKKADEWIAKIAAAQEPDGYLNTYYSLKGLDERWTDMEKHEDYCAGHLFEAAVAYYQATGKRQLLDVAIRFADHIDRTFRQANRPWVSGHQEIELALIKLYRTTGEARYLSLADWFLEQRGHGHGKGVIWDQWKDPAYCQDAVPVKQQKEITGHAVRAMYLYTGAADVAAITGDIGYMSAMKTVWEDVVHRNMYVTGGIGSSGSNEGFSTDFDLPNEQAYCETCASVGMVFWNQRMGQLTGDGQYMDILERSLYNGALDGLSLTADRFFYGNPLASKGQHFRREWFGTACCPSNIARLVASLGNYIYGSGPQSLWINLYVSSETTVKIQDQAINVSQTSQLPWGGRQSLTITTAQPSTFTLYLRLPDWAASQKVPGGIYHFVTPIQEPVVVHINGQQTPFTFEKGYALINRTWQSGDQVTIDLPMTPRFIQARTEVSQNVDRLAIQRGPLVYCVEGVDHGGQAWHFLLDKNTKLTPAAKTILDENITALTGTVPAFVPNARSSKLSLRPQPFTAIPYYTWANRGQSPMQVWLPTKVKEVKTWIN